MGNNQIGELPLAFEELEHMHMLAAPNNAIEVAPRAIGCLQMLVTLDLSHNRIAQIPIEWGNLKARSPLLPAAALMAHGSRPHAERSGLP